MMRPDSPRSAYVHVPFCRHRCHYCNFTVVADRHDLESSYLDAIELELQSLTSPRPIETLFLGGGTPTELSATGLIRLCQLINAWFPRSEEALAYEATCEANPDSCDEERVAILRDHGFNRISLGVQSFDVEKLRRLDRSHTLDEIEHALQLARSAFPQVSLDLIFAAPGESVPTWQADLEAAIAAEPSHISTYGLTIEHGTRFWNLRERGELREVDDERQREMYLLAIAGLSDAGFDHYEVSNFARPGGQCRHNETYWKGQSYFAVGPGASRYVDGVRQTNHRSTSTYLRRMFAGESPVAESETIDAEERAREILVFGLRRREGIAIHEFAEQTGFTIEQLAGDEVSAGIALGLLKSDSGYLQVTIDGLMVIDSIVAGML